jgi:HEAT repeat protein/beta-lactamase regulating signal transducer with metallopeptidase domain
MSINPTLPVAWLPLADAVVKATLILAMAAAASFALRRKSAAMRHLVWILALCSALALPVISLALPKWQLPILRLTPAPVPIEAAIDRTADVTPLLRPGLPGRGDVQAGSAASAAAAPTPESAAPAPPRAFQSWIGNLTWQQVLVAVWLLGATAVMSRLLIGLAVVRWLSRRTQLVENASWLPMARALAARMGIHGQLRFLRTGRASMPVAAGIFRPSVIMPEDADRWPEHRLRIVLLHELAHVKRRDCLTHLLAQAACAFYWFNPLAWIAANRARAERERACDDLVLASGTRGSDYADQLLDMARGLRGDGFAGLLTGATLAMAHRSQLEGRLIAILDPRLPRAGVSRRGAFAAIALCACAVAPLGALQPWTADAAPLGIVEERTIADASNAPRLSSSARVRAREEQRAVPQPPQRSQAAQPVAQPQPSQAPPAQGPQATAILTQVLGPIAQVAVDAIASTVGTEIAKEAETELEREIQEPKPGTDKDKPGKSPGRQADPRMVAALTAALKDSDKEVRETAMHALVQLRDPSIFEPLTQALKDASPEVREQAVFGLAQLRDKRAVEPLVGLLKDQNAEVRKQVVFALGQLRDRSATPGLIAALKDASHDVREQAAFALGQLRDISAVDGLAIAVRDDHPEVRQQAVFALSQIRDVRAVSPLISALKDPSVEVRKQAAFALGQLRDKSAVDALVVAVKDGSPDVREQVVFALGQIRDPRAIDALMTAIKDTSADVRQQAAFALGQLAR